MKDVSTPLSTGMQLASRVTSIGMQMALPALAGWWADSKWGTKPWLLVLGAALGFLTAMLAIVRLANNPSKPRRD